MPYQLVQYAGGAGFVGTLGFEFPGEVVGQFDYPVALRLVRIVVKHVQSEMGQASLPSTFCTSSIIP